VDDYSTLLRVAVATAGNDHRLGGNEAPPAIISVFLGEELTEIIQSIITGSPRKAEEGGFLEIGVSALPRFRKDATDRNRTSPFAFTGNKFEFRMTGASASIAGVNFVMNAIVADVLGQFADELENIDNFQMGLQALIKRTFARHERVIFNGNNYAQEWLREAESRGLPNYPSTVDALPHFLDAENIRLMEKHRILTEEEMRFRLGILLEGYSQTVSVEALTMLDMGRQEILPAALAFGKMASEGYQSKKASGLGLDLSYDEDLLKALSREAGLLHRALCGLEEARQKAAAVQEPGAQARAWHALVAPAMEEARAPADRLEAIVGKEYWPFPTYADLLFSV
jgi:glutamine synthetase